MSDVTCSFVDRRRSRNSDKRRIAGKASGNDQARDGSFSAVRRQFNSEQIDLFDGVLDRLIKTIELRAIADVSTRIALAEMSSQLAPLAQAPPSVVRRLAGNDEIAIAGPVLAESARLNAEDLIEIANTKGEQHLLAISGRWWLKEIVTDVILARRYPAVSRRIINNPGARVSRRRICDRVDTSRI